MKNKFIQIVLLFILFLSFNTVIKAQGIKDVFILVDVSGTMNNKALNSEARSIVKEILTGSIELDDFDGWTLTSGAEGSELIVNPRQLIQLDSYINIIPFGDKYRCKNIDTNKKRIDNLNDFEPYFDRTYNFRYNDQLTFLNLLKSYVAGMAQKEDITFCYVITITDNLIDETGSNPYSPTEDAVMMAYETEKMIKVKNIGIISKTIGDTTCKIYMEKFEQFTGKVSVDSIYTETKKNESHDEDSTPVKFKRTNKTGTNKDPLVTTKGQLLLKWNGGTAPYSLVIREFSSGKVIIDETISSNSKTVYITKSGLYKTSISDAKGSNDEVFIKQNIKFPFGYLILVAIIAIIAYVIFNNIGGITRIIKGTKKIPSEPEYPYKKPGNPFGESSPNNGDSSTYW